MNCAEYKELLVAFTEGLLSEAEEHSLQEHLKGCAVCRAELEEINNLRSRLVNNGKTLVQSNLENVVLERIIQEQNIRLKTAEKAGASLKIRRLIMKSPITKLAAAAVIIIAAIFGISQFFGGTVTFAKVIEPILNARTVIFDYVIGGEETGSVMHNIVVGSKIRRTFTNMDIFAIIDLDNARMLTLDPKTKGGAYVNIEGPLKERTKDLLEFIRNVITDLKDLPVEELGQQNIDGLEAIGFKLSGPNKEFTIWANPETARPIRIEVVVGQSLFIFKNFEFDVPVDESLVSMEPPDGYTLSDKTFDMTNFTEQDFITLLRLWVEHLLGGNFPQSLSASELVNQANAIGEKVEQLKISDDQKKQLGLTMGRGMMFFGQLDPMGTIWHYAGSGVKLGDAGKAVFWYQPKGSSTYRVIYGDLSVKDVKPEDLPK
jgi:hypothetical protein